MSFPESSIPFSYRQEVLRKLIHLSSLWMVVAIAYLGQSVACALFAVALVIVLGFEVLRRKENALGLMLRKYFGAVLRQNELEGRFRLSGAPYVLMAGIMVCLLFNTPISIASLSIMLVADSVAALVGKRYGRYPFQGKTLEGSCAFMLSAMIVVLLVGAIGGYSSHYTIAGMLASVVATVVELYGKKLKLDDNLTITLSAATTMWLVQLVIG